VRQTSPPPRFQVQKGLYIPLIHQKLAKSKPGETDLPISQILGGKSLSILLLCQKKMAKPQPGEIDLPISQILGGKSHSILLIHQKKMAKPKPQETDFPVSQILGGKSHSILLIHEKKMAKPKPQETDFPISQISGGKSHSILFIHHKKRRSCCMPKRVPKAMQTFRENRWHLDFKDKKPKIYSQNFSVACPGHLDAKGISLDIDFIF